MKPDDHLTNDDLIAPPDAYESPHEERIIVKTDPLATNEEDYERFQRSPHAGRGPSTCTRRTTARARSRSAPTTLGSSVAADRFRTHVPVWVIAGCAALLLWAGLYLGSYSGGFQGDVFNEAANYKPSGPTGPVDPIDAKARSAGTKVSSSSTASQCHQADGNGQAGQYPAARRFGMGRRRRTQALAVHPPARHPGDDPCQGCGVQQPDAFVERRADGQADRRRADLRPG